MASDSDTVWGSGKLILFRFIFLYLVLYNFPFPLNVIPVVSGLAEYYTQFWQMIVVWVGKTVFQKDITVFANGSGDTTSDYILVFCYAAVSIIAAFIWTFNDAKRTNYSRLFRFLHVYVRYVLAITMITYGTAKIIQSQFPGPSLDRLLEPYGDSSPMGLLWTFMGFSYAFNIFTGLGETVGGLLLIFKRTTCLGGLTLVAVLANVVILNFTYDVPVKLYSAHLLLMTFFVLLPDMERLVNFLLLNKSVEPVIYRPLLANESLNRRLSIIAKSLVIVFTIFTLYQTNELRKMYGDLAPKSPFYGIWNVEELEIANEPQPALLSNETRWRRVVFDNPRTFAVQLVNDTRNRYVLETDLGKRTFSLSKRDEPNWATTLNYSQPDSEQMILEGTFENKPLRAKLRRTETRKFLLMERGFNWINEFPFNR